MSSVFSVEVLNQKLKMVNGINLANCVLCFSALLLLSFNLLAPDVCLAQPIETGYQDYLNFKRDYWLKLQDESLKRSKDPEATQEAFVKLYKKYVRQTTDQLVKEDWEKLNREAKAFLRLTPTEPFSRLTARKIILNAKLNQDILDNAKMLDKAASEMKNYSLESRLYAAAAVHYSVYEVDFRRGNGPRNVFMRHLDLLIEWMSQSSDPPEYLQRMMYEAGEKYLEKILLSRFGMHPVFKEKLDAAKDKMSPWLTDMLLAEWYRKEGWNARGENFFGTVKNDSLVEFEKDFKLGVKNAKHAYKLHPERPEAATMMIRFARYSKTDEDERTWFDRAVGAEFDFSEAYEEYLFSLKPSFGGSHEAMIDFATECVDTDRYDTLVPLMLKTCYSHIRRDALRNDPNDPLRRGVVDDLRRYDFLPQISAVSEKYQAYLRNQEGYSNFDTRYYRAWEFSVAFKLRQFDKAYAVYQKYHGDVLHPDVEIFSDLPKEFSMARVIAHNGAAADEVQYIDEQTHPLAGLDRSAKESRELLQRIEEATAKNDLPGAAMYFEVKRKLLRKEIEFHRGKWVNLKFTPDLRYWSNFDGRYVVKDSKTLHGFSSSTEPQYIAYGTSFPTPYEVELTVKGVACYHWHNQSQAGIVSGRMYGPQTGRIFWTDTLDHRAGVAKPQNFMNGHLIGEDKSIRIKLKVFDRYYEMFDGVEFSSRDDPTFVPGRLGLGLYPWRTVSGEVHYSDFRIRKLNEVNPPPPEDKEARIAYFQKRLETEKAYLPYMEIGDSSLVLARYDEAIIAFEAARRLEPKLPRPDVNVGIANYKQGEYGKSVKAYEAALKKCDGNVNRFRRRSVLKNLIELYASCSDAEVRDGKKAKQHAKALWKTKRKRNPLTWSQFSAIAAADAEVGDFKNAIKNVNHAINASGEASEEQREGLQKKLALYKYGKPFHEEKP